MRVMLCLLAFTVPVLSSELDVTVKQLEGPKDKSGKVRWTMSIYYRGGKQILQEQITFKGGKAVPSRTYTVPAMKSFAEVDSDSDGVIDLIMVDGEKSVFLEAFEYRNDKVVPVGKEKFISLREMSAQSKKFWKEALPPLDQDKKGKPVPEIGNSKE